MGRSEEWSFCDGTGKITGNRISPRGTADAVEIEWTRRQLLVRMGLGALGMALAPSALSQLTLSRQASPRTLVVIFLRGGADGLSLVVPHHEDAYYQKRPNLSFSKRETLALDERFGLNQKLSAWMPFFEERQLAVMHAVGSFDGTRSHFEAMRTMETGSEGTGPQESSGWLARFLQNSPGSESPLRAVSFGGVLPESLRGSSFGMNLGRLDDFRLRVPAQAGSEMEWTRKLSQLYSRQSDALSLAGIETIEILNTVQNRKSEAAVEAFPDSPLGKGLEDLLELIRLEVGVEVACLDHGLWDTHVAQGKQEGWISNNMSDLAASVATFWKALGRHRKNTTVVIQTEFGRRVEENVGLGTDHGRSSTMFVLDERLNSKGVVGHWPGLGKDQLDEVGDLRVGTDYRDVLSEVLHHRFGMSEPSIVFPGHRSQTLNLFG